MDNPDLKMNFKTPDLSNDEQADERGLSSLNALLCERIAQWEVEANFLDNPDDADTDRACGRTYRQCAKELRVVLGV